VERGPEKTDEVGCEEEERGTLKEAMEETRFGGAG
jgi:hypothetical protein